MSTDSPSQYLESVDARTEQVKLSIDFIKRKGPFKQTDVVIYAGDFNIDANIATPGNEWTIQEYLADPEKYPEIEARREDVLQEFENLVKSINYDDSFTVVDAARKMEGNKRATFGVTTKSTGSKPSEKFFTSTASRISNRALDHIF